MFVVVALLGVPLSSGAQSLPSGWSSGDIGNTGAGGWAYASGSDYGVSGSGADIWGSSDAFHFAYRTLTGDGEIVVKVTGLDYMHAWTKAGVMMRDSLSSGSRHAFMLVSAGKGAAFQRRTSDWGASTNTDGGSGSGGYYVKLARTGSTFNAYKSGDGSNWVWVGSDTISMSSTIYVGMAVTSHYAGAVANAYFTDLRVSEAGSSSGGSSGGSSSLPSGWATGDIGKVGAAGWAQGSGGDFSVNGSGADIWGSADEFHFTYRQLTGDGSIVTRVTHVDYLNAWSKAGVMMRDSLSAGASHAFMLVSAGKGLAFQRRVWGGGSSTSTAGGSSSAPVFLKLTRSGDTFSAYASPDGSTWYLIGVESISMGSTIYVGLGVTSHADGSVGAATFSDTVVTEGYEAAPAPPSGGTASGGGSGSTSGGGSSSGGSSGGGSTGGGSSSGSLRVLHWNVHHLIGTDGVFNPGRIAWWVAHMHPDIISLNEVDDSWYAETITSAIQAATGVSWNTTYSGWGNLILTRLPLNASSVCTFNSSVGRKAAHLSTSFNGRPINLWSAHLGTESSTTRLYEVYALQSCAAQWGEAAIIAGDFNMQQSSTEYAAASSGYTDAWAAARAAGTTLNYSGNCDGCTRNSRIDYVFSSHGAWYVTVESAQVYDTRDGSGYMPSDHKPLVVTYSVR